MFDKWIKGDRDSEEFSVSGIFWILLDTDTFMYLMTIIYIPILIQN